MSMYVQGKNPEASVGEWFHRNIWCWSALWSYCASVSPEAASLGGDAYLNGGAGLDAEQTRKLAAILREQLESGATKAAVTAIENHEVAPAQPLIAEGFITELGNVFAPFGNVFVPRCCFDENDVRQFVQFLEHSGGFSID